MEPPSTTAMMMILLPCFNAVNGLGRGGTRCGTAVGVVVNIDNKYRLARLSSEFSEVVLCARVSSFEDSVCIRFRGKGAGNLSSSEKRASNCAKVGIGVV
jgi:hypothetical protein